MKNKAKVAVSVSNNGHGGTSPKATQAHRTLPKVGVRAGVGLEFAEGLTPYRTFCGVYFSCRKDGVVDYIGSSNNVARRFSCGHCKAKGPKFFIETPPEDRLAIEGVFIAIFRPRGNKGGRNRPAFLKEHHQFVVRRCFGGDYSRIPSLLQLQEWREWAWSPHRRSRHSLPFKLKVGRRHREANTIKDAARGRAKIRKAAKKLGMVCLNQDDDRLQGRNARRFRPQPVYPSSNRPPFIPVRERLSFSPIPKRGAA